MVKIIITMFLLMMSGIAQSQQLPNVEERQKPVHCAPFGDLVNFLKSPPYNEVPTWIAKDGQSDSKYALFVNPKTGGWTLIQFGSVTACVLGTGDGSEIIKSSKSI